MNHSLNNLNKIQQEIYLKISETKNVNQEIIYFTDIYNEFEDYSTKLYQLLIDLEVSLKSEN